MNKITMKAMAALVLGLGLFTACSSNDEPENNGTVTGGSTYMSVAISLPSANGSRADKQADTKETEKPDYNFVGKWAGQDKIEKITIYVFNDANNLEAKQEFSAGQFQLQTSTDDKPVTIAPLKGIKVLPGDKTVYAVVNPTTETDTYLSANTLDAFKTQYGDVAAGTKTDGILALENSGSSKTNVKTSAGKLAKVDDNKDVITMTAIEAGKVKVEDNVSQSTTIQDAKNRAKLTVKRTVARVMITSADTEFKVEGDDPFTTDKVETDVVLGTVKNIKYVVGQGEKSLYFMQRSGNDNDKNLTYRTPFSEFIPTKATYKWDDVKEKYDYSSLWKGYQEPAQNVISGTDVPTLKDYAKVSALTDITADLKKKLSGEFILPNTHTYGADQDKSGYRKNNTAYVLVRALFVPKKVVDNNGDIITNYPEGKTFFMGANGIFYESSEVARDANKKGVAGQTTTEYVNGKTLYYAWVNPDNTDTGKWLNSPVNRNNIYHIQISGFKRIGANWNPLVPPVDPNEKPDPNDPNNPDPKPNNPNEPDTPPVNPDDPLTPKETWMSVETTILPWNVHSYSVVLDM